MTPEDFPTPAEQLQAERASGGSTLSLERAYHELRHAAVLVDRTSRSRGVFTGPRAAESLTGLVTNDVLGLRPGHGQYAAALNPKGKIIADVRIFAREDELLVDIGERAAAGWWAMIRKFVNPRLARFTDVSEDTFDIGVFGPRSAEVLGRVFAVDPVVVASSPMFSHQEVPLGDHQLTLARVPDAGVLGFEVFGPRAARDSLVHALREQGAAEARPQLLTVARIEAGRPEWGPDMDETTLAQEANMEELGAISFTKGCYTGQETVARVHFRGHVNRRLRQLLIEGDTLPPSGAELLDEAGRAVGDVRSVAHSPQLGGVALAMVRREVADRTPLAVRWDVGRTRAVVGGSSVGAQTGDLGADDA